MAEPLVETLPSDLRGEGALPILPVPAPPPSEVMLFGDSVRHVDAWGASALRVKVEYLARYQQRRVTLSLPSERVVRELLHALIRHDCPRHLVLPTDSGSESAPAPQNVLVGARRVPSLEHADAIVEDLSDRANGRLNPAIRFAAKWLPELALNALTHGKDSPVPPIACVLHEREEDELQLVVVDLGLRVARSDEADTVLESRVLASPEGALSTLVGSASHRGLDVTLTLAAGTGRLYWRNGRWRRAVADEYLAGFTAVVTVPI